MSEVLYSKFPQIGISIFATMTKLCREYNAINMSQGCPDFECDPNLFELVNKYLKQGFNQYSPMEGILPLRESISEKIQNSYQTYYHPANEITITAGATEAVYCAVSSVVQAGDEVIIFEPAFDSYIPNVLMNGGIPVPIALSYPHYKIDWEEVRSKVNQRTKLIILNSPHNPTGQTLSKDDIQQLIKLSREYLFYILSDEVYEHIIFDNNQHESIAAYPELKEKSFVIFSFGKTFHNTGWRLGYCLAPEYLSTEFRKVHQFVTFSAVTPMQYATWEYMSNPNNYLSLPAFYQAKRDKFLNLMQSSRFDYMPSQGTYFQLMSFQHISDETDVAFSERLIKEYGVASIPLSPFYQSKKDERIVRFCFAKKDTTLEQASEILCKI